MLDLTSVMLGTSQIDVMASFYEAVFERKAEMVNDKWHGWQVGKGFFGVGEHSEVEGEAKDPQRIIYNFSTTDVKAEFDRIEKIEGVKVIKEPYKMAENMIATFADPDGNYFQIMTPWE